jgi:hypothetical protein
MDMCIMCYEQRQLTEDALSKLRLCEKCMVLLKRLRRRAYKRMQSKAYYQKTIRMRLCEGCGEEKRLSGKRQVCTSCQTRRRQESARVQLYLASLPKV